MHFLSYKTHYYVEYVLFSLMFLECFWYVMIFTWLLTKLWATNQKRAISILMNMVAANMYIYNKDLKYFIFLLCKLYVFFELNVYERFNIVHQWILSTISTTFKIDCTVNFCKKFPLKSNIFYYNLCLLRNHKYYLHYT